MTAFRAAVWLLLILAVVAGFAVSSAAEQPAYSPPTTSSPALYAKEDPGTGGRGTTPASSLKKFQGERAATGEALAGYNSAISGDSSSSLGLLPAYRWNGIAELGDDTDYTDAAVLPLNSMANFFFGLSQFIWSIVLGLLHFAMTTDLISKIAGLINSLFAAVAKGVLTSGVFLIVFFAVIIVGFKAVLSGKANRIVTAVVMFVVPLAFLQFLATTVSGPDKDVIPSWSPAWLAVKGTDVVNAVGAGPLTYMQIELKKNEALNVGYVSDYQDEGVVACPQYMGALTSAFQAVNDINKKDGAALGRITTGPLNAKTLYDEDGRGYESIPDPTEKDAQAPKVRPSTQQATVMMASQLWEAAFLAPFAKAQYGDTEEGMLAVCKQLEMSRGTPSRESYAIVGGVGNGTDTTSKPVTGPFQGWSIRPFVNWSQQSSQRYGIQVLAWAACSGDKGTKPRAGFRWITYEEEVQLREVFEGNENGNDCLNWSTEDAPWGTEGGVGEDDIAKVVFGVEDGVRGGSAYDSEPSRLMPDDEEGLDRVTVGVTTAKWGEKEEVDLTANGGVAELQKTRDLYQAYWGHNSGERLVASVMAVAGAGMYGVTLGGMALGQIFAQLALALLLMLLPITLLLLAMPTQDRSQNPGWRMLKMTGSTLMASFGLLFTLTLLVIVTGFIVSLDEGLGSIGDGVITTLAPLAAFIVVGFVYKKAGLGSMMSPGGALGMVTAAAKSGGVETKNSGGGRMTGKLGGSEEARQHAKRTKSTLGRKKDASDNRRRANDLANEETGGARAAGVLGLGALAGTLAAKKAARARKKEAEKNEYAGGKPLATRSALATKASEMKNKARNGVQNTKEALARAAKGDFSGLSAMLSGKPIPGKLTPGMRVTDREKAAALLGAAALGLRAGATPEEKAMHRKQMAERQLAALGAIGLAQGRDDGAVVLTDAQRDERLREAAVALGLNPDAFLKDSLPLDPILRANGNTGNFPVRLTPEGDIDYAATLAGIPASAVLSKKAHESIGEVAAQLEVDYKGIYTAEDCTRAATQAVLFDMGLVTATGSEVHPMVAAGLSDAEMRRAVDEMKAGVACEAMAKLGAQYDQRQGDNFKAAVRQNASYVLDNVAINPIVSMDQINAAAYAKPDVMEVRIQNMDDLLGRLQGATGANASAIRDNLESIIDRLPDEVANASRKTVAAEANLAISSLVAQYGRGADTSAAMKASEEALRAIAGEQRRWQQAAAMAAQNVRDGVPNSPEVRRLMEEMRKAGAQAQAQATALEAQARSIHSLVDSQKTKNIARRPDMP